jgi:hypothetical protein
VSPATVKTHLEHIYRKLGARGRAQAVAMALTLLPRDTEPTEPTEPGPEPGGEDGD